jgi:quercetin dioxygenase-like cupin family protein
MTTRRQALNALASAVSAVAAGGALSFAEDTAPAGASKVSVLLKKALPAGANEEVTLVTVAYAPGAGSDPHRHPGPVIGYVLEGEVEIEVEGEPRKTYAAGEVFFEPQGVVHKVSRNASKTKPAKLLAFVVGKKGAPVKLPANGSQAAQR